MKAKNINNGEYRLGLKCFSDLAPHDSSTNQSKLMKKKSWDGPHKIAEADIQRRINEFDAKNTGGIYFLFYYMLSISVVSNNIIIIIIIIVIIDHN